MYSIGCLQTPRKTGMELRTLSWSENKWKGGGLIMLHPPRAILLRFGHTD
jgi:hypothetical protein